MQRYTIEKEHLVGFAAKDAKREEQVKILVKGPKVTSNEEEF